jgi:hypothetical protein
MANEIRLNASMSYEDSEGTGVSLSVADFSGSVTTKLCSRLKQNVGITEEGLRVADVVNSLGWVLLVNRDATNSIDVKTGTGGLKFARLLPNNGFALFYFGSDVTSPYVIANTATCQMDILLISS